MNIKFSKPKAIEQKDIEAFSHDFGYLLSDDLINFFLEFNGSKPESNFFIISENNESRVNELIPISSILEECKYLDQVGKGVFPIAIAEGGNYVVVDLDQKQSVYFWDHEKPKNMTKLANNIYDFLDHLMPFDLNSVELKNEQIESVWIDPDFLKRFK